MKLIMTLLVRDEQDIIRENIEFHLAQGVDFFIATDNRSVDDTASILKEYEAKGLLHYIYESSDDYNQHAWVTRMARMASTRFGADWVINNDADEFWWPLTGSLKETFEGLCPRVNLQKAERYNFVVVEDSGEPFWSRMVYREKISLNPLGNPLPPKVAHRGKENIKVRQGNHSVEGFENPEIMDDLIEILHFPIRSNQQIVNKILKGGAAYERNQELPETTGITWRKLYAELEHDSNLERYFQQHFYDPQRLRSALDSGELIIDSRLAGFYARLDLED